MYHSISFHQLDFQTKVVSELKENGVVVINDVFEDIECNVLVDGIVNKFCQISPNLKTKTWNDSDLPPQTRPGLFQGLVSNFQEVWTVRSNQKIKQIFETVYSGLRNREMKDFIVSGDGINVRANIGPCHSPESKDWAHLDQTSREDIYKCVQGQAVLTNTTASFRATPKSHHIFEKILDTLGEQVNYATEWLKFNSSQLKIVQKIYEDTYGNLDQWQIPILSKKGSFILWLSSTIHSAKLQDKIEKTNQLDKFFGWRCVIYVCYRPKEEFTEREIEIRQDVVKDNLTTNHWGTTIFGKKKFSKETKPFASKKILEMIEKPTMVYDIVGIPILDAYQKQLLGY